MTPGDYASQWQHHQEAQIGRDGYIAGNDLTIHHHYPPAGEQESAGKTSLADIRRTTARARFLAALRPRFRPTDKIFKEGYDASQVDKYMNDIRTLASRDMTELQAYLAATPRNFREYREKGYYQYDVNTFMGHLSRGLSEYAGTISIPIPGGRPAPSSSDYSQIMEGAQSSFLAALRPRFRPTDKIFKEGYDASQVDKYMNDARTLASRDMTELQAYLAMTPRCFKEHRKGYYQYDVDTFMRHLHEASEKYSEAISQLL